MLTMSLRGSSNPTSTSIADGYVTLNGSESSKSGKLLYGQGSGAGASGNYTNLNIWYPSSGATANTFGNAVINIPNYTSNTNKALSIDMVSESNETFTYGMMFAGLWANTAAITSVTLTPSGTTWAAGGCAVSVNTDVSPDGSTTADRVNITNGGGHFLAQNAAVTASTAYTFSFWVKRGTATALSYSIVNNTTASNIVAPTSYYNQTSSTWTRVSFTFTTPVGCTNIGVYQLRDGGSTGTVLLWGAQLEAGSFPTSYIPTTTASVVRSADLCSISGSDFAGMFNGTEGTLFASFYTYGSAGFGAVVTADPASDQGKIQIAKISPTQADLSIKDAANNVVFAYSPASSLTTGLNKSALAYKSNDSIATVNNFSSALDTSVTLGTQTRLAIGNDSVGSGRRINGSIASIRVYKKRLSLAKLQALTV